MIKNHKDKILVKHVSICEDACYTIADGKVIILIPQKNLFYTLNPVATKIWQLSADSPTIGEIAKAISKEFEVSEKTAVNDTLKFIKDLIKINLLCLSKERK